MDVNNSSSINNKEGYVENNNQSSTANQLQYTEEVDQQLEQFESLFNEKGWFSSLPLSLEDIDNIKIHTVPDTKDNPMGKFVDEFSTMIQSTKKKLTISTLWFEEENVMETVLKNGLRQLNSHSTKENPITVRLLIGQANTEFLGDVEDIKKKASWLLEGILEGTSINEGFSLGFFSYHGTFPSRKWNHSKIIAVDSHQIIVGGINFVKQDHLNIENPVHDVSLYLNKENIAEFGHEFITQELSGKNRNITGIIYSHQTNSPSIYYGSNRKENLAFCNMNKHFKTDLCFKNMKAIKGTDAYIVGVGKGTDINDVDKLNTSKNAMLMLINTAKEYVYIAQRSIATFLKRDHHSSLREWEEIGIEFCRAIGNALHRGVRVEVILAGYSAIEGYHSAVPKHEFVQKILETSEATEQDLIRLSIGSAKNKFDPTAQLYAGSVPLHSKVVMADNDLMYVGSHNAYWNGHVEFGFIIKSKVFVDKFRQAFCQGINPKSPESRTAQWNSTYSHDVVSILNSFGSKFSSDLDEAGLKGELFKMRELFTKQKYSSGPNTLDNNLKQLKLDTLEKLSDIFLKIMAQTIKNIKGKVEFIASQTLLGTGKTTLLITLTIPGAQKPNEIKAEAKGKIKDINTLKYKINEGDTLQVERDFICVYQWFSLLVRAPILDSLKQYFDTDNLTYQSVKKREVKEIANIYDLSNSFSERIFTEYTKAFEKYTKRTF